MKTKAFQLVLISLFTCFVPLLPTGAVSPPPDGGYSGGNTAEGQDALMNLLAGTFNTAIGYVALASDSFGQLNTAVGAAALVNNAGDQNTAIGAAALLLNGGATQNTAVGTATLVNHIEGDGNTAIGAFALYSDTNGGANTAVGNSALFFSTGIQNTAVGWEALGVNTNGNNNTADGTLALSNNAGGSNNVGLGFGAGGNVTTANNVTCIGANVQGANVTNTTWIANVYGVATQSGTTAPVIISDSGQLGTVASSERFKKDIVTMNQASEAILSLRPVAFHYKTDAKGTPQYGLIAEEVAKVNPALVLPDKEGKPYTVRYEAVNAMLLNEFLKEHRKVQEQGATIARLEKQVEVLTAGLQKVSAQLEMSKPAPQTADNNH